MSETKETWLRADPQGFQDFWRVYDERYEEILAETLRVAREHPEFGPIVRAMLPEQIDAQNRESRERLRRAIAGDWKTYETELRAQGQTYAKIGITFAGWYDVVRAFQQFLVPSLTRAFGDDRERLDRTIGAMQAFIDRTMVVIGEEYLRTKENLLVAERALTRDSEDRYRMLFDNVPVPMWVYDRETLAFLAVNQAAIEHYGFSEREFLGMTIEDIRFAEDLPKLRVESQRRKNETSATDIGEWRHRKKDGRAILVELRVRNFTFAGRSAHLVVVTDVTERRRIEKELEKAEQPGRFFTLSLDLLCIAGIDGYFKRVNPGFAILGYPEDELLARPFLDFVHPGDRVATIAEVEKLGRGEQTVSFENRYRCKDDSYRTLLWTAVPHASGFIYAAARDITERKRVEEERAELNRLLRDRNEELLHASRAKSEFLAMMSHELRTPLNSIIGFSEVLVDGRFGTLNEKQSRYLQNVYQSGKHLLGLINDILDLSKIEAGRLEIVLRPCAPRTLTAEAVATLQPLADARSVRVHIEPAPGAPVPVVSADPARLKQVLYNLLSNAIKFSPQGGRVTVACGPAPRAGFARISVSDGGTGIAEGDIARLFTPFTQLANAKELGGTGLGLALTKQLVDRMGGSIGVQSNQGEGSTFHVDLPVQAQPVSEDPSGSIPGTVAPLALIVDDDPAARELLVLSLQQAGFRTLAVASGEEAIAQARRQRPDVITLDVFLPTIDGWDVLRLLKGDPTVAAIPVVMVTISSDRARAFSLGALEHLIKPVARDALLETLARHSFTTRVKSASVQVLAIDDDTTHLDLVRATLEPHGFLVRTETSGRSGLEAARSRPVDLILLDLELPDISGIEVVTALRADERTRSIPILLVTAHELSAAQRARLNGEVEAIVSKGSMHIEDLVNEISRVIRAKSSP